MRKTQKTPFRCAAGALVTALVTCSAPACDGGEKTAAQAKPKASARAETPAPADADADATAGPAKPAAAAGHGEGGEIPGAELAARVAQFVPARLTADTSGLPESEQQALAKLIEAARHLDPLFDRQAHAQNPEWAKQLAADTSPEGKARLEYFRIMRGPWDRQDHHRPFASFGARPPGAGFYPSDLDAAGFDRWIAEHPGDKEAFSSLLTVIAREGDGLVAKPYRDVYKQWLEPSAKALGEAADLTKNKSLQRFLRSRAKAFLSDDYYQSDKDWMDLDSRVEITIGPYETYEDSLKGLKASYEAFVTVSDPKASEDLMRFKALLPDMEQHLPVPDEVKVKRGAESPIRVVDLVYSSGDARKSVQTIAFNLPNDERVRKEKGAKKVLLRNLIETKFDKIMRPIAEKVMVAEQLPMLSSEAFFLEVLFHELSHSLGPAYIKTKDGSKVEVRVALGADYSSIEEAKADALGAFNVLYMIEKGEFPKTLRDQLLFSYFAGLFRSVRFGVSEAHGQGAAAQINYYIESGAARFDPVARQFRVDLDILEKMNQRLVTTLIFMQHAGDPLRVRAFLKKYAVMSRAMEDALAQLDGIPVDIRPIYPLAGEGG